MNPLRNTCASWPEGGEEGDWGERKRGKADFLSEQQEDKSPFQIKIKKEV